MQLDEKILKRLDELIKMGEDVLKSEYNRSRKGFLYAGDHGVDYELALHWGTSCLNILSRVFGEKSDFYKKFNGLYNEFHDLGPVMKAQGILKAAKDDYERDLLFDTTTLVEAEVFDDFLEQAKHLLDAGYFQAGAVIAGSVLEDGLRKLCHRNNIELSERPKLDDMNADLARQGVYNKLQQKRITVLADIRNKAAHGNWEEIDKKDAEDLIAQVRTFMETYFS